AASPLAKTGQAPQSIIFSGIDRSGPIDRTDPLAPEGGFEIASLPLRGSGNVITDEFGPRSVHPVTGKPSFHGGIDLAGDRAGGYGRDILAAQDGVVVSAGFSPRAGNTVVIEHDGGWRTQYLHNEEMLVAPGDRVKAGDHIAEMGSTGRSRGPHLDFQILNPSRQKVDPRPYLEQVATVAENGGRGRRPELVARTDPIAPPRRFDGRSTAPTGYTPSQIAALQQEAAGTTPAPLRVAAGTPFPAQTEAPAQVAVAPVSAPAANPPIDLAQPPQRPMTVASTPDPAPIVPGTEPPPKETKPLGIGGQIAAGVIDAGITLAPGIGTIAGVANAGLGLAGKGTIGERIVTAAVNGGLPAGSVTPTNDGGFDLLYGDRDQSSTSRPERSESVSPAGPQVASAPKSSETKTQRVLRTYIRPEFATPTEKWGRGLFA
ncbi:MAG: peptidoglycan DD-metalloendopeptidase family protein, partial [Pseudomonadota bacterium]